MLRRVYSFMFDEKVHHSVHFALEAFQMYFVCQGPVESHNNENRVVLVR